MKNDNYLTLCLDQAAKSSLRYRHGSIIVRGGKVIGQGFNDHRPGFNGEALKTGGLPISCPDGSAIEEFKKKRKLKREKKDKFEQQSTKQETSTETFRSIEAMGGGNLLNAPLSMHSEMMAIHSAIAASSTLASIAISTRKPCVKVSCSSKRKARLRRNAIKVYAERGCNTTLIQSATEQRSGLPSVQKQRYESFVSRSSQIGSGGASLQRRGERCGTAEGVQYRETAEEAPEEPPTQQGEPAD